MKDNQNRNLDATKKRLSAERKAHDIGIAKMDKELEIIVFPEWQIVEGVSVLRIENNDLVAVPISGRKTSRKFDIINILTRKFICQVSKNNVHKWLMRAES